jgi:hypothetical protein
MASMLLQKLVFHVDEKTVYKKKHAFHVDERRVHFESCRFAYTKQPLLGDLIAQC